MNPAVDVISAPKKTEEAKAARHMNRNNTLRIRVKNKSRKTKN